MFTVEWGRTAAGMSVRARSAAAALAVARRYQAAGYIDVTVRGDDGRAIALSELETLAGDQTPSSRRRLGASGDGT